MHEAAQINLIVSDLAATRAFYERFGWSIRDMGDSALLADAGGPQWPGPAFANVP